MALKRSLIKLFVVKRTKFTGQSPEGPDQLEVRPDDVNHESDPCCLCELNSFFSFHLRFGEGISYHQKIRDQLREAIGRVCKVTHPVSDTEGMTYQVAAVACMFRRGDNNASETHTSASLITFQSALLQ